MNDCFADHVDALHALLPRIRSAPLDDASEAGEAFLAHVYELGRAITLDPALASEPRLLELIAASAEDLQRRSMAFVKAYDETTEALEASWEWTEDRDLDWDAAWIRVCVTWSSAGFLRQLWSGTRFVEALNYFTDDDEYLDELRAKGAQYGPVAADQRPPGIPPSHWWWWYPEPAPSEPQ